MGFSFDLRSDTVTKPSRAMRQAMFDAPVGDDVFEEDPTINDLEKNIAALLGMEAGLFVPSGVMANQIAIHLHTRPGDTILCEEGSHVYYHETGAAPALSGVQFDTIPKHLGFDGAIIAARMRTAAAVDASPTTLVVIENTHNRGGGRVTPVSRVNDIAATTHQLGMKLHCDGARLWNAAVSLGVSERDLVAHCDSVAVCFSKALGALAGSMLCGTKALIKQARRVRKRWGGGMRQIGLLGAAAWYAVQENRQLLGKDHALASGLAETLAALKNPKLHVNYPEGGTNMVFVKLESLTGPDFQAALNKQGIGCFHFGEGWVRFVTHFDLPDGAGEAVVKAIRSLL